MPAFKIIKRDGKVEDFDPKKIANVVTTAGLTPEQAEFIADKVFRWIEEREQPVVSSFIIRMKIMEELEKLDKHAANLYSWYGKTKDETIRSQK